MGIPLNPIKDLIRSIGVDKAEIVCQYLESIRHESPGIKHLWGNFHYVLLKARYEFNKDNRQG